MSLLTIVVGTKSPEYKCQWAERENLANILEKEGCEVERTKIPWPRDHYVFSEGVYVTYKRAGSFGEGGCIHTARDFMIVSREIFPKSNLTKEEIISKAKQYYPSKRVYLVPQGYDPLEKGDDCWIRHIDLTCLLIPLKKLLFVDMNYYSHLNEKRVTNTFSRIAEKEDLNLIFHNSKSKESRNYFPMNCLVIPSEDKEVVVANKRDGQFLKLLRKQGFDVIEVDMYKTPETWGSIRCCTNLKDNTQTLQQLLYP